MAKQTLKEAIEEVKKEENKLVAVEMTEAEKEQFIKYKQALDAIEKPAPKKYSEVVLRFEHLINNVPYGPGPALAEEQLAGYLFAQDEKKWASQIASTQENKKVVQMFLGGQRAKITEGVVL